jgi:adenylate cyclase
MTLRRGTVIKMLALGLSGLITLFFLFVDVYDPAVVKNSLDLFEMKSLDLRFRLREAFQPQAPSADVAVIAIDERSIRELGRWPWSRAEMARLVRDVAEAKPRVIGLDILFSEPEVSESQALIETIKKQAEARRSSDPGFLAFLNHQEQEANADTQFAHAIQQAGNVVLPIAMDVPTSDQPAPARPPSEPSAALVSSSFELIKRASREKTFLPIEADAVIPPIPLLAERAKALGHVYYQPDRDGVLRWEYLVLKYGDDYYPSFSLQVAREALGLRREAMQLWLGEAVNVGSIRIPTDERGRILIDYAGGADAIPTVSATDILHGRVTPDRIRDKIVLIGTTALGTYDLKVTPLSANLPGVEKNAMVVDNIIHRRFLYRTDGMKLLDAAFIVVLGGGLWLILPRVSALQGAAAAGAMIVGYLALAQYLFQQRGLWINLLYPTATLAVTYTALTVLRFMTEERRAKEIRQIFSSYVSPKMVAELVKDPEKAKLGGARKQLTVLFSDVRGFTAFSEQRQPEEVVAMLNEYMNAMTDVIFRWDGTLDKFVGDAIMVFWGAPLDQPHHAELAIRCALHMRKRLAQLQDQWRAEGKPVLDSGIGINSGEMVVGNMGAEGKKMDYTVIGDNVNLGARVESLTRHYNAPILITESTYQAVKELVEASEVVPNERRKKAISITHRERRKQRMRLGHTFFKDLGAIHVKGKAIPVRVFETICTETNRERMKEEVTWGLPSHGTESPAQAPG